MKTHEKIRLLRKERQWTQEDMADKLGMSVQGYAKIEQGKTKCLTGKLEQIAQIFEMDIIELISYGEAKVSLNNSLINHNVSDSNTFIALGDSHLTQEITHLQLVISHQKEIIETLKRENRLLFEMNEILKTNSASD